MKSKIVFGDEVLVGDKLLVNSNPVQIVQIHSAGVDNEFQVLVQHEKTNNFYYLWLHANGEYEYIDQV